MSILISCFGSAGDVYPFLAIGQALQARGETVTLLSSPWFAQRIEAAGLGFLPVGTRADYEQAVQDPLLWHPRKGLGVISQHLARNLRAAYAQIEQHAQPDTLLVGSTLAWNSRLAQEKLGLRGATVHLAPACLFSAHDPAAWPKLAALRQLPPWLAGPLQRLIEASALDPMLRPGLNQLRRELGLPPVRHVLSQWTNSPDKVICAFPDWFAAPQRDWPAQSVCTDFPRWSAPAGTVLDPLLTRFLSAGQPVVGITPGSAMAHAAPLFERALAACDSLGLRALLITPYREQLPAKLPSFARHTPYVPFDLVLPHLSVMVHHGGIGTLAQCVAAGVPQLITPFAHDQFDNAARLATLGAGLSVSPTASVAQWSKALLQLSRSRSVADACYRLAERSQSAPPAAERIASEILSLRA